MAIATAMPNGFFGNTQEIYVEVASYSVVPPEKIRQYWNVYTTTFRRLVDPTAFRLENFWWHVWGSDRRNLSGPALAKLFKEFSNGPTVVPLTLPSNRHESQALITDRRELDGTGPQPPLPPDSSSGQVSASSESRKAPTPSSSRPPPPHPILKKSRGPSASGPRPTARFASPPCRNDQSGGDGSEARSTTAAVTPSDMPPPPLPSTAKQKRTAAPAAAVSVTEMPPPPLPSTARLKQTVAPAAVVSAAEMPPPPLPSAKAKRTLPPISAVTGPDMRPPPPTSPLREKANSTGRKVVAATAVSRRRPVVMRRQSSQSSTGSDTGSRVTSLANPSAKQQGNKRQTSTTAQLLGHGSLSPQAGEPGAYVQSAGKRPAKAAASKRSSPRTVSVQTVNQPDEAAVSQSPQTTSPPRISTADVRDGFVSQETARIRKEAVQQPAAVPPPVAGFVADTPMVRSRSNNEGPYRLREPGVALLPSQATSSVAMFTTTARGQFDSETVKPEPTVPEPRDIPDRVKFASQPSSSGLLDLQFRPTPPNPSPPIPFGRSRSELTLLLEREKTRKGEGS
ncbi:hypothetical protein MMYC01_202091 [Madurella mycetomatis]|uniref:Nitrogen regulatory protein areA GATA-like domain-containing protein n=1 Tax=Madurella mycetomatis TaxID=100816 RepID=A0A175WBL2_9PEZI|nr:hypothetical protein MMYC01_202091 [Madurella mycetomatis]